MSDQLGRSAKRIAGLIVMIAASAWMGFSVFFAIGVAAAWIEETGLTTELQPWVWIVLFAGAISATLGYGAFRVGRWLRGVT